MTTIIRGTIIVSKQMNDTLAWDISGNWDDTTCLDIDPDTLYALPHVEEAIA